MFGIFQNKEHVVIEAIQKLIEREKTLEIKLFEGLEEELRRGESIDPGMYYLDSYITEQHASGSVDNISSRTMYQALQSLSPSAEYDVDNDYASVTLGNYDISIKRYKDGSGTYVLIGIKGTYKYIEEKLTKLIECTPVSKSEAANINSDVASSGMTFAQIEALSKMYETKEEPVTNKENIDIWEEEIPF